jgi:xylulokinase
MGRIDARGARWSGLPLGTPVTVAGHDHLAAWAGAGARGGDVVNSVGTAETVVAVTGRFPDVDVARSRRVAVTLVPGGDAWGVLASAARSGIVLAAVAGALGASPADLDQAAVGAASVPGAEGVITAALAGRPLEVDGFAPGDLWHAVLAALAARTWEACDRIAGVVEQPRRLVVCGGGSRSRPWLEAKAAARPTTGVYRSGAREAVARGAALYAGLAAGWWAVLDDAPRPALESVSTG